MDWSRLYDMQKNLDTYIETNHPIDRQAGFSKKYLALLVELGELANETRCFKFWSNKPPSDEVTILEEYVDVLHFILSLGIEKGYRYGTITEEKQMPDKDITYHVIDLFKACTTFGDVPTEEAYNQMVDTYLALGRGLGFGEKAIEDMYFKKNTTNYHRQDTGY